MAGEDGDRIVAIGFCLGFGPAPNWYRERARPPSSTMPLMHLRQRSEKRPDEIAGLLTIAHQSDSQGVEKPGAGVTVVH